MTFDETPNFSRAHTWPQSDGFCIDFSLNIIECHSFLSMFHGAMIFSSMYSRQLVRLNNTLMTKTKFKSAHVHNCDVQG